MDDLDRLRGEKFSPFIYGDTIEIGAAGRPVPVNAVITRIRYADINGSATVYTSVPQLPAIVGDATLPSIPDGSLDTINACHVLEHMPDLIGTVESHISKLRTGGRLCYILPDKDRMFDAARTSTTWQHLIDDRRDGGKASLQGHVEEWRTVMGEPHKIEDVHLHCWSVDAMREMVYRLAERCSLRLRLFESLDRWPEVLFVLEKE